MKRFLFMLIASIICLSAQSGPFSFSRLDNTDGLSNNQVQCIYKDSKGFMWFGTNYGLNRYDGYNFKVFKSVRNDSTSLPYNTITRIQEDAANRLWLESDVGYVIYDPASGYFMQHIVSLLLEMGLDSEPKLVEIDARLNYYFYYPGDGIYQYDVASKLLKHFPQKTDLNTFSKGNIVSFKISGKHIWALFESGMIERYNVITGIIDFRNDYLVRHDKTFTLPKRLFIDSDGEPWVFPGIADKGVMYLKTDQLEWVSLDRHHKNRKLAFTELVRDVAQDASGSIWIASDHGGVDVYDKKSETSINLKHDPLDPNSLNQNSTISLFCDNTGIMWVGTYKNGVCYYHPDQFTFAKSPLFHYQDEMLQIKDCNSLYEDSNGILWIGTNGEGLIRYDPHQGTFKVYQSDMSRQGNISSDIIISILEDSKGDMWFGTFMGGLNHLKNNRFIHYLPEDGNEQSIPNKSIYGMVEDTRQNIWVATLGGGVAKLDPLRNTFQCMNTQNTALSSNYVLSLYSRDHIQIFLSTSFGASLLNTETGAITLLFQNQIQKLSDIVIHNIYLDNSGNLWLATNNGLNIYHPSEDSFSYLDQTNGLPSEQVVSIIQDDQGAMWAGTRKGLARIVMEKEGDQYHYSVVSFDEKDGLASPVCNQNAIFKSGDGLIYVGTTKGYTVFDPQRINFNTIPPLPQFTELLIDNQIINPGQRYKNRIVLEYSITGTKEIKLHYNDKNFTVHFSSLNYIHTYKSRYQYMLKGYDKVWNETNNGIGAASYANLFPGTYELLARASNNDGVWNEETLSLKIIIQPPFWLTWWAYLVYLFVFLLLIWGILKYSLNKQKRKFEVTQKMMEAKRVHDIDEMKFRFFTNVSHEFRTPLTLIINPIEKMLREQRPEAEKTLLNIIYSNARLLLELVNQILEFRKLDVGKVSPNLSGGDVVAFIRDICYSFSEWANKKSISYSFTTSVAELQIEFDKEKYKKIISNLLSNAFKFTPENGKIAVNISISTLPGNNDKTLHVQVSDTGSGIAEAYLDRIFDRFFQIEHASAGSTQSGTGIGLHLSNEYARLLQGKIDVKSRIDEGSVFTFSVPVKVVVYEEVISHQQLSPIVTDKERVKESPIIDNVSLPLLLIVDDNDDFRDFMSELFKDSFRVIMAKDGEIACQKVLEALPDLIISDVMMPNKDGLEFCREVKADIRTSHIPVILLTAKTSEENQYSGIEAGADDYIAKPFNMDMLKLKVTRLIAQQKRQQERFRKKTNIALSEVEITSLDEKFVQKAVQIVEANIGNADFLVEDLVRDMAMSRVYFYKKILSLTAKTPSEFIRFIRLKRAASLLEKSQLFVNEVAYQVGFNDLKYFRKYFKEEFGVSPNEYKKRAGES